MIFINETIEMDNYVKRMQVKKKDNSMENKVQVLTHGLSSKYNIIYTKWQRRGCTPKQIIDLKHETHLQWCINACPI